MPQITAEKFTQRTGHAPEQDDLARCNCDKAGTIGHQLCGWDEVADLPVFMLGASEIEKRLKGDL